MMRYEERLSDETNIAQTLFRDEADGMPTYEIDENFDFEAEYPELFQDRNEESKEEDPVPSIYGKPSSESKEPGPYDNLIGTLLICATFAVVCFPPIYIFFRAAIAAFVWIVILLFLVLFLASALWRVRAPGAYR